MYEKDFKPQNKKPKKSDNPQKDCRFFIVCVKITSSQQ